MLQLVAASKRDSLLGYMSIQPNKESMRLYRRVKKDGGHWYIVVLGAYNSKQDAQAAIKSLPKQQRDAGPWPRPMSLVKMEIEEFQRNSL